MIPPRLPSLLLCAFTTLSLPAQDVPLPDGTGRLLHVFDLHRVRPGAPGEPAEPRADTAAAAAAAGETAQRLAEVLRQHVEPPLGVGDDLAVLGGRWLTLLGSARQIHSLERLLAHTEQQRDALVTATVRLARVPDATFQRQVRLELVPRQDEPKTFEAVLSPAAAGRLERLLRSAEGAEIVAAPRLTVHPLQRASLSLLEPISYVRDFTLERHGDRVIADPVVGVVEDGVRAELCAVPLADGTIAVHCDVVSQQVQQPIPSFETDLGVSAPVTIQLPRTTGVRFRQAAVLASGQVVVLASQQVDGDWLLALVEASLEPR